MSGKNIESVYPLSPMQRGMLFHSLYAPESGVYCTQLSCVLEGDLNYSAFEQAWQRVVDTHPILRTAFMWEGRDKPLQVVQGGVRLAIVTEDWREQTESEQQEQLRVLLATDQQRGFQVTKAPLMRLTLLRLGAQKYQLIWTHHHLLPDGWSALLLKDVFALYEGLRQGVAVQLERSRPYKDYIGWLQQQDLGQAESYWREKLKGFTAPTELGLERSGAASGVEEKEYSEQRLKLSVAATSGLQQLARGQQLTLNTIVQGAWGLLLSRYSGAEDVVFGAVVSGRPAELRGVEQMLGLFINTLPVRVRVREEMKVGEWLRELQGEQVELRQYEYSPLVAVQGWSEVERGRSLFESLLVFENYPVDASLREQGGSLKVSEVRSRERTGYPLTIVAVPGRQLLLRINYDSGRFEAGAMERLARHFEELLAGIVAAPEQRLSEFEMLTAAERRQLVTEWNDTAVEYASEQCLHELFEQQVERTPEAVALVLKPSR